MTTPGPFPMQIKSVTLNLELAVRDFRQEITFFVPLFELSPDLTIFVPMYQD
jgi:hypothetical protein